MQAESKKNTNKSQDIWSKQIYRQWQDLQRQYATNGWKLLEYPDHAWKQYSWHIIFDSHHDDKSPFTLNKFKSEVENKEFDIYNQVLVNLIQNKEKTENKYWESFKEWTNITGVLVPQSALIKLGFSNLTESVNYIQLFSQQYPFHQILRATQDIASDEKNDLLQDKYKTLWFIIEGYTHFIAQLEDQSKESVTNYLFILWNQSSIYELLPSTQLTHALIHLILDIVRPDSLSSRYKPKNYWTDVSKFITSNELELRIILSKKIKSIPFVKEEFVTLERIKQAFYTLCTLDIHLLQIQEYLDKRNNKDLWNSLPVEIQRAFSQMKPNSMMDQIQSAVQKKSIIERIKSLTSSQEQNQLPHYYTIENTDKKKDNFSWHQLSDDSISTITTFFRQKHTVLTDNLLNDKMNRHTTDLFNRLTRPVLEWKFIASTLTPIWNTTQHENLLEIIIKYNKTRELEIKEAKLLIGIKKVLIGLTNKSKLDKYILTLPPFKSPILIERLNNLINSQRINIINRRHFSIRKMEEFGISEELEPQYRIRELYLEELLNIEKAVRPYVLYVKKAFDSALPENRENFFDPYRHSIDGIEFDQETVQQVDKWLKGEVMKTINIKPQIHDALQINCFAMDSSGSMDHDKMRNLFKLIYLIVTGLSGKATYDSFHFFGTHFIPAAEFRHSFDSKNLLYKILRKITHVTTNGIIRYGGVGGTYLSGAIMECHQRITDFAKPFNKKEINYFKTLFVITDGEPSIGIVDPNNLAELIKQKRQEGDVTIKGIYVGPPSKTPTMPVIFGKDQYVETTNFSTAIVELIDTMSKTYKEQRTRLKQRKKTMKS